MTMQNKNPVPLSLVLAGVAFLGVMPTTATTYTFNVRITNTELTPPVSVGQIYPLTITVSPVPSGSGNPGTLYPVLNASFAYSPGNLQALNSSAQVKVVNDLATTQDTGIGGVTYNYKSDHFTFTGSGPSPYLNGIGFFSDISMSLRLSEDGDGVYGPFPPPVPDADAISSDALPTTINLTDWQSRSFSLTLPEFRLVPPTGFPSNESGYFYHTAVGIIESVTIEPDGRGTSDVPDTGTTLPLLGLACAGLAWARRR
jgi:hypothetical protein